MPGDGDRRPATSPCAGRPGRSSSRPQGGGSTTPPASAAGLVPDGGTLQLGTGPPATPWPRRDRRRTQRRLPRDPRPASPPQARRPMGLRGGPLRLHRDVRGLHADLVQAGSSSARRRAARRFLRGAEGVLRGAQVPAAGARQAADEADLLHQPALWRQAGAHSPGRRAFVNSAMMATCWAPYPDGLEDGRGERGRRPVHFRRPGLRPEDSARSSPELGPRPGSQGAVNVRWAYGHGPSPAPARHGGHRIRDRRPRGRTDQRWSPPCCRYRQPFQNELLRQAKAAGDQPAYEIPAASGQHP